MNGTFHTMFVHNSFNAGDKQNVFYCLESFQLKHGRINSLAGHTVYAHFHGFRGGLFLVHLFPSRVYTRCTLCILCTIA